MSYYMGDFYTAGRGDFYRGDPGVFGFLGRAVRGAVGMIPGVGPIAQKVLGVGGTLAARAGAAPSRVSAVGRLGGQAISAIKGHPVLSAAGAAGIIGGVAAGRAMAPSVAGKGFHVSRRTGKVVRNRHMRVTNVKALRRSLRRVHGFARIAKKVIHITHPRRGAAVRFKFRRKRKSV